MEERRVNVGKLSPYIILDGHRSGSTNDCDPAEGYIEGAILSMRLAMQLQRLGCSHVTFLVHTIRNRQGKKRMAPIFEAVNKVTEYIIQEALKQNMRIQVFGKDIGGNYEVREAFQKLVKRTEKCDSFIFNIVTNYSEEWAWQNGHLLQNLPEMNVIVRFTKGHYSGVCIPKRTSMASFVYVQQASISRNWSDVELERLSKIIEKSYNDNYNWVGNKSYTAEEKENIREQREEKLWMDFSTVAHPKKRVISFTPLGPVITEF